MKNESKKTKKTSLLADCNLKSQGSEKKEESNKKHHKSNSNVEFAFSEKEKDSNHLKEKLSNFMSNYDGKQAET